MPSGPPQNSTPNVDAFGVPFDPIFTGKLSMDMVKKWIVYWTGKRRMPSGQYVHEKLALLGDFDFAAGLGDDLLAAKVAGEQVHFVTIVPCVNRNKPGAPSKSEYGLAMQTMRDFKKDFDKWRYWDQVLDSVGKSMPDAFECVHERAKVS